MINWVYQWYRPGGILNEEKLIHDYTAIFFDGLTANKWFTPAIRTRSCGEPKSRPGVPG